jgi:hypothetical protein
MPLKRKIEDAGGFPAVKRARRKQPTCTSLEDEEIVGALGKTTSSAHSHLLLNDKGDDVLVLDNDKDLLWEMFELLNDFKL